ncbi:hypothetical protein RN04_04915 [Arthrobacter sp. W1]|nr:hypothetical protein RN04_04915 [Arthrobacter sp. W1]
MHFLDRASIEKPECLGNYVYPERNWDSFGSSCKKKLRAALVELQGEPGVSNAPGAEEFGVRCAYCESFIHHDGHIEHFRRKNPNHFPELTFSWENLFLACGATTHCGHFKDAPRSEIYDPNDLVKPDVEDPRPFFFFSVQGSIHARDGLSASDRHKAVETIRVFNLDDPNLVAKRRKAMASLREKYDELLSEFDDLLVGDKSESEMRDIEALISEWIQGEIQASKYQPFSSAVQDLFA